MMSLIREDLFQAIFHLAKTSNLACLSGVTQVALGLYVHLGKQLLLQLEAYLNLVLIRVAEGKGPGGSDHEEAALEVMLQVAPPCFFFCCLLCMLPFWTADPLHASSFASYFACYCRESSFLLCLLLSGCAKLPLLPLLLLTLPAAIKTLNALSSASFFACCHLELQHSLDHFNPLEPIPARVVLLCSSVHFCPNSNPLRAMLALTCASIVACRACWTSAASPASSETSTPTWTAALSAATCLRPSLPCSPKRPSLSTAPWGQCTCCPWRGSSPF